LGLIYRKDRPLSKPALGFIQVVLAKMVEGKLGRSGATEANLAS